MPNKELHYFTIPEFDKDFKQLKFPFKGDKENEDRYRLKQFLESL